MGSAFSLVSSTSIMGSIAFPVIDGVQKPGNDHVLHVGRIELRQELFPQARDRRLELAGRQRLTNGGRIVAEIMANALVGADTATTAPLVKKARRS